MTAQMTAAAPGMPPPINRAQRAHSTGRGLSSRRGATGLTLIELMVCMLIIAILAGIAYPSYQSSVLQARRSQARVQLLEGAQFMAAFFARHHSYADATLPPELTTVPRDGGAPFYRIALRQDSGGPAFDRYELQATPVGVMADDVCGTLTLDHLGRRRLLDPQADASVQQCWAP